MIVDHLRTSELSAIDTRTPEGLGSLIAILGQALQARLTIGEAQRDEEARKAAEAKAVEKKRKRDEKATTGSLSPRTLEKKRRKDERDAIRKEKLDLKKKEEERKKLPLITLAEEGIPTELAYTGAKSTIRHIVSTNFARGVEWGTLSKVEQKRVINQASEGESESSEGSSDEEERAGSTAPSVLPAPSATTSSGPSSFASRNQGSAGGKDKENREEEGQGDDEEREEDEQPPPPPENIRKKDSREKSKRGRKSR
ncbi:unnamed protein product [Sphagnum jensenii]|uniref:Uncharacterized protein n=1 Tax=Sphagnum jensenii TaxID=128206 RepID=A0ABP1B6T9_9BRYO